MNSQRPRWPIGTLALMGLCVVGMLVGVILALNPPESPPGGPKRMREFPDPTKFGPLPSAPNMPPRDDLFEGPPAPAGNDSPAPRSR